MESKIRVIQDAFELEDHFPSPSVVLAPSTLTLMNAERTLVTEATYICPEGLHVRCQIRIGPRDLHILAVSMYFVKLAIAESSYLLTQTRKRTLCNDIKIETQDYISAQNIAGVYHRRRIYGTVTFDICLTNGVRLVLLDVEEPDVFVKVITFGFLDKLRT